MAFHQSSPGRGDASASATAPSPRARSRDEQSRARSERVGGLSTRSNSRRSPLTRRCASTSPRKRGEVIRTADRFDANTLSAEISRIQFSKSKDDLIVGPSFRDGPEDQTSDAQLRIGESRDSPMCNCTSEVRCFASPRNDSVWIAHTRPHSRGAIAPELCKNRSPERAWRDPQERAWGMPGARRTRSLACKVCR
jgi:hypothetical protein